MPEIDPDFAGKVIENLKISIIFPVLADLAPEPPF